MIACCAVRCCLCGAAWEEVLVGAALVVQGSAVGALCPRCLGRPPAEAVPLEGGPDELVPGLAADLAGLPRLAGDGRGSDGVGAARFTHRYGLLAKADVARVVDDRYRESLSGAG